MLANASTTIFDQIQNFLLFQMLYGSRVPYGAILTILFQFYGNFDINMA